MSQFVNNLEKRLLNPIADLTILSAEEQFEMIKVRAAAMDRSIVSAEDLLKRLKKAKETGKPLKIKFGIDPTGPEIHLGHAVPLLNLRLFQRMGHKIILIIGDFTAMIGDPTGRVDDRPPLNRAQIEKNMASYIDQASRVIDLNDPSIEKCFNSEWMDKIKMSDWVRILGQISFSEVMQREDFRKRIDKGAGLSLAEIEYSLFMAYDSVILEPDVELGGLDQYLNLHMCRNMMAMKGQEPEIIITYDLLCGTSGEKDDEGRFTKMSKSRGNYIPVMATPEDMYGKVMSIPDDVMWIWFNQLTEIKADELRELKRLVDSGEVHPKVVKQMLSRVVTGTFNYFNAETIAAAEEDFNSKFGKKSVLVPENTPEVPVAGKILVDLLCGEMKVSKSEIVRMADGNGVKILREEEYVSLTKEELYKDAAEYAGSVVKVGKRRIYKLV